MVEDNKGKLDQALTLDASLDDIEDLPGFVTPASGAYELTFEGYEQKEISDHPALEGKFKIDAVLEITDDLEDGEEAPKAGDQFSMAYMLDNKFGVGNMKKEFIAPLAKAFNTSKINETLDAAKGAKLMMVIKRTYNKEKDRHYSRIKKLALV